MEVGACLCLFTYSVQETLKEPLHGVKIGVNFLVVLKHKQPKNTQSVAALQHLTVGLIFTNRKLSSLSHSKTPRGKSGI